MVMCGRGVAVFCYCHLWLDNRCMYVAHVCCVSAFVENSGFLSLGVLKYVVFSVCIARRGATEARVWEG